jgi:hypothetical protein
VFVGYGDDLVEASERGLQLFRASTYSFPFRMQHLSLVGVAVARFNAGQQNRYVSAVQTSGVHILNKRHPRHSRFGELPLSGPASFCLKKSLLFVVPHRSDADPGLGCKLTNAHNRLMSFVRLLGR